MSYEDSFEREAADERAYERFESWYIFENLKPSDIGKWEWLLMFDQPHSYSTYSGAALVAKEMARELRKTVSVQSLYEGHFEARPEDYYDHPEGSSWLTYASKRAEFVKTLVVEGRYPDLVMIADESNDQRRFSISRHYFDEVRKKHQGWTALAKQAEQDGSAA